MSMALRSLPNKTGLQGKIKIPGDKSMSHRSLMMGGLASGTSIIKGLLEGDDVIATADAMRAMGADIKRISGGNYEITGTKGILKSPNHKIDCGNSGTSIRLLSGLIAGAGIDATMVGDASLSKRPMNRVINPLQEMGAQIEGDNEGRPPLKIKASKLKPISYEMPVASAQVKSCIMLAGLFCDGITTVIEQEASRDHTETMLKAFGVDVDIKQIDDKTHISLKGGQALKATPITVPSDPSSAAFFMVAALIIPKSWIVMPSIMLNPTRAGLITTLQEMGGDIEIKNERIENGEKLGDIHVRSSNLTGISVPAERAVSMIDEYPILSVAAAFAKGTTTMEGLAELRVKETDRIQAMEDGLKLCRVDVQSTTDSIIVSGQETVMGNLENEAIKTHHDHRIAMSFLVLGLASQKGVIIDDGSKIATSFPTFLNLMQSLDAKIEKI